MPRKYWSSHSLRLMMLFSFITGTAAAQQWIPNFKHYGIRDGLPSSEVYQVTSDSQKNLWFVTDRGVVRYDGFAFRVFDKRDSLPDNSVIKVYKDVKERVWFISYTGLLSYYENGKINPYRFNPVITQNLGTHIFTSLYVDKNENVFFNGIEGNIYKIDSAGNFSADNPHSEISLYTITDHDSGTPSTFYYCVQHQKPTRLKVQRPNQVFDVLVDAVIYHSHFSTVKLRNNDLIFYCGRTLVHFRNDKSFTIQQFESVVLNVFEEDENQIWVGCYNDGVYVCDTSLKIISHHLTDVSVSHVYADYEGGLWFSTLENGIFYLPSKSYLIFAAEGNILREKINTIMNYSDSVLFFATTKGILYKFNSNTNLLEKTY